MFLSAKSLNKIESLKKRALRFIYNDYESLYDIPLAKSDKLNMKASRLRSLCVEIYKIINSINPSFMNETFRSRVTNRAVLSQHRLNVDIPKVNQVSSGNKSIRSFGSKIWNSLPHHRKPAKTWKHSKEL